MKLIRFSIVLGLLSLALFNPLNSYGQIYSYKNFTHKNGLPLTSTDAVKEKQDGGILIGTQGAGIVEYNGYTFHEVIKAGQDNNHHVTGIEIIGDNIFFTSRYKGLLQININGKTSSLLNDGTIGDYTGLFAFQDLLIVITKSNIYKYDLNKKKQTRISDFNHLEKGLTIHQMIRSPKECILLTNKGNYIITSQGNLISLSNFFNTDNSLLEKMTFGYYKNGLLYLFDEVIENGMLIELKENSFNFKEKAIYRNFSTSDFPIVDAVYNEKRECFAFFTYNGNIFEENDFKVKKVPLNTQQESLIVNKGITDYNGNYWITTNLSGLFKIGLQPFTKLDLHKEFTDRQISYVHLAPKGNILFSNFQSNTFSGNLYSGSLKHHPIGILSGTQIDDKLYFGTHTGIYEYREDSNEFIKVSINLAELDKRIQFMSYQAPYLWVNVFGEGLYKLDKHFNVLQYYKDAPKIIYTGQFSNDSEEFYMGTPGGITKFNISKEKFSTIESHNLGYYCGLSVKDVFGTSWFTLESGIIGISKQGELFTLSNPSLFPSYLFYTLNADNYGNLIIGTNKGLNVIQINERGKVLNQRNFSPGTDFEGYETHIRSSFQGNNSALVGTLEGLYQLDFRLLQHLPVPNKPTIEAQREKQEGTKPSVLSFRFLSKNPQIKTVLYTYRIINHQEKWSPLSQTNDITITDLKSGEYTIEVKATYDGIIYSEITQYPIQITLPILRGNTLVIALILVVIAINALFYSRSKKNASYELFYSKEFSLTQRYAPSLIFFGFISHILANEIVPFISNDFEIDHVLVLLTALVLLVTCIQAFQNKNRGANDKIKVNIIIAFSVIMIFNIYSMYQTSLHPFYGFSVILIGSVAPLIFEKTKHIVLYTILFIGISIIVILSSTGLNYDKYLLIIPIVVSGLLSVFMNLIRYDSVHQLAFISSIINKSDVLALAMNKEGVLKYISKNITCYIDVQSEDLIDKPISFMNAFIPAEIAKNIDLKTEFRDGKRFSAPLLNLHQEISWFEWSCKEFSEDVRVLIGQDITEKINLQSTYEILVENAEDLIYQVDINGNFQFLNNRFNDYLPHDKDLLIGKNITEILPEAYKELIFDFYIKQLKSGEKVSYFELPMFDSQDQTQWFGQYVTLLFPVGDNTKATGFLVVGRNITEKIKKDSIISLQSADITSSINYAKRIQLNLLPSAEKIESYFSESFIIYKPKDIVSGDFYWCNQFEDYTIVAVGDGTGHGVPGAFMSILGINLLNSIIIEKQIHDPGRILDELDSKLKKMLSEGSQQKTNDGIEISVCVFNEKNRTLEYACAGSKLIIHDSQAFSIRKGDNKHIGDQHKDFQGYVTHHHSIESETTVYLFTDGFYDQFGGVQQKKYSIRRLLELLMQNIRLPLQEQQKTISNEFENWKMSTDQTDDVTVMGLRLYNKPYENKF